VTLAGLVGASVVAAHSKEIRMTTAAPVRSEPEAPLSAAEMAALDVIMAECGAPRDIVALALAETREEFAAEPRPADAVDEEDAFLRRYTRRRFFIESEQTRVKEQMQAMLRTLSAKLASIDYLNKAQAEEITRRRLKTIKGKSIKFPHGTVGVRATPGSVEFLPEKGALLMEWCKQNLPAAIKPPPPPELLKTPISDHIKLSDEVPPGVKWNAPGDKFYVS
jgi:hypothetical protein